MAQLFRTICLPWLALFLSIATAACSNREDPAADLLIENVTAIDAVAGVRAHQDVLIVDGKIVAVQPHNPDQQILATRIIDGQQKYLIPGLWDAHVHLTYLDGLDYETFFPLSIAHGVTSLRDTGGHLDQLVDARRVAASDPFAPDLYVSGPLIDGPLRVYAGQTPFNPDISVGVASAQEARDMIDELAAADVDFIKAYEMLSQPTFEALVEYAAEQGLPVSAHVPLSMTSQDAARAGVGDMQHLRNLELSCHSNSEYLRRERRTMLMENDADEPAALRRNIHRAQRGRTIANMTVGSCDDIISLLAEHQIAQTPTLMISRFLTHEVYGDEAYRQSFDLVPSSIGEGWKQRSASFSVTTTDPAALAYDAWLVDMISRLADAGVPIMAGTDAPIGFLTPGVSLHYELLLLVDAGLSPLQVIGAATLEPARFFNIEDEIGTIAPGMAADLVLLSADPISDIRNIGSIEMVLKHGTVIDRVMLDRLLKVNDQGID